MKKVITAVSAAAFAFAAFADAIGVKDDDAKTYTVTVASGSQRISDEDAAAILALDAGYAFVKAGAGTLVVSNQIASFAGQIVVTNGMYEVESGDALGVGGEGAETFVREGATLSICNRTKDEVKFAYHEAIHLVGEGYNSKGALYNRVSVEQKALLKNSGYLVLDGDAKVCGYTLGFSGSTAYLNGHELTVQMVSAGQAFNLTFVQISTAGDIHLTSGRFFFDSAVTSYAGGSENTFTAEDGTSVAFRNAVEPIPWTLVVNGNVGFYPSSPKSDARYNANVWAGPVVLNGRVQVSYASDPTSVGIKGPVSGTGYFSVLNQNKLHLSCPTNTFTGGVLVTGSDDTCQLTVNGKNSLPPDGGALEVHNGIIKLASGPIALPTVNSVTAGSAIITNTSACSSVTTPSISKDGAGILKVFGGIDITNTLSVCTGKVELAGFATNAQNAAGLYLYSTNFGSQANLTGYFSESIGLTFTKSLDATELRSVFDHVVDIRRDFPTAVSSADMAFVKWSAAQKWSMYAYTGYFRNLAETNVTVTFGLSIWDVEALWIDGKNLIANSGTKTLKGKTYCLQLGNVKLSPGPHKIEILLGHWTSSTAGANSAAVEQELDWPINHGFVMCYGASTSKFFVDGGYMDVKNGAALGTVLTRTADPLPEDIASAASRYRAEFANLAGMATGTLDLGGDMVPRSVSGLSGTLTVENGALEVAGEWEATLDEVTASPLIAGAGARLSFGAGAAFAPDESFMRGPNLVVLAETSGDGEIEGAPACDSPLWKVYRLSEAGITRIYLARRPGSKFILR